MLRATSWLALLAASMAFAAGGEPLFDADGALSFRLEAPFRTILRARETPEYRAVRIVSTGEGGADVAVDLRARVRGRSRVQACPFPPLLLNFPDEQPEGSPFAGENRLKLVTYCNTAPEYEQYVRLERQVYLALNALTDASLRTRLVTVTYYDTDRARELATRVGFLIEDEGRFAERKGLVQAAVARIDPESYAADALALIDVFQYFVGNTDWSALAGPAGENCCHNVVPYARGDGKLLPVPYDFDATGIVGAPYSLPDERLPIRNVRQRLYRGRCRELAELEPVFRLFVEQRAALTQLFTPAAGLAERSAARAREYIDDFYRVLEDPERKRGAFSRVCGR